MKITLSLTQEDIIKILQKHIQEKTAGLEIGEVRLYVMSKSNYRQKTWEPAAMIIKNEPPINCQESDIDTEIRSEVDAE